MIELVLGVQFRPIGTLSTAHMGAFWRDFLKAQFPTVQEQLALLPQIETFDPQGPPTLGVTIREGVQGNRCWFLSADGNELVQVQQDRFLHNWRKHTEKVVCPRFSPSSEKFLIQFEKFVRFLADSRIGEALPEQ